MEKKSNQQNRSSLEKKILIILSGLFVGVIVSGWIYALNFRQTIVASNSVVNVDVRALVEIEKLRNTAESQISYSRTYFLLGSKSLFDEQKKQKQTLVDSLANFEKQYSLPQIPEIIKNISSLEEQQEEIFDQAMKFREKQTESKIVGQFYQSKIGPIRTKLNQAFDEMVNLHNAELDRARARAREAAIEAEVQIPQGMTWFTGAISILFLALILLIIRMLRERTRQLGERQRLFDEGKKAILSRDEVIAAVSEDLKEPLDVINQTAESLTVSSELKDLHERVELIKSSVNAAEGLVRDILDQTKADMGHITLRLDQLAVDSVLDEAKLMLQPLAKQKDVKLQFDSARPPVLAFFDRERVLRVLSNLIGNAIKFSPKHGRIDVKVKSDQQFVYISVADSGPGIPENQQATIFDHFWQSRKTAEQGAGVGLAVVKTIIEAHGGTVRVSSQVGRGSTFTFSLPRWRPAGAQRGRTAMPSKENPRSKSDSVFPAN